MKFDEFEFIFNCFSLLSHDQTKTTQIPSEKIKKFFRHVLHRYWCNTSVPNQILGVNMINELRDSQRWSPLSRYVNKTNKLNYKKKEEEKKNRKWTRQFHAISYTLLSMSTCWFFICSRFQSNLIDNWIEAFQCFGY